MTSQGSIEEISKPVVRLSDAESPEIGYHRGSDDKEPVVVKHARKGVLGFFSGIERTAADEIEQMAESITFTEEEAKAVRRKIDLRVLPIIVFSYIFNQFGAPHPEQPYSFWLILVSGSPLRSYQHGITDNHKWTTVLSVFYTGYCLLEIPSNILQRHIGANRFLSFWGLSSVSFVYAKGYTGIIILRILLGIGEAGYYAGMIYYLSFWRVDLSHPSPPGTVPGWISGLLAFGLVRLHSSHLAGWQFLYLVEGLPTLLMAIVILLWLPPFPFAATFLTKKQRAIALARLKDHKPRSHGGATGWQGVKLVLMDPHSWCFVVLYCSFNVCVATISYFLPTLIKKLGYTSIQAQGLTVGPYLAGMFLVWFQAWHSDKTQDRGYHIMGSALVGFLGYALLAICAEKNYHVSYFAMYLIVAGIYSLFPLVMSWASNTMSPTSKRGVGTAFIVSISNCISIASPQIYFDPEDSFRKAHAMSAGFIFLACVTAFVLRTRLAYLNKKRDGILERLPQHEKQMLEASATLEELADHDVRYRYMT
ncbi:MFS general substrate transporter [Cantharellus anzutake]|uniref:MFS general substrate transporter n=1 Tax=Cantharellus anzutake TaxID=1750568 RepID=UPI001903E86F|nr:MFS general substrate transporter [Cantharellus anzutake]KAF8336437.1 MFS general substrate transporter [Cantharellus anzutake]